MKKQNIIKKIFLSVVITLFCYRGALLLENEAVLSSYSYLIDIEPNSHLLIEEHLQGRGSNADHLLLMKHAETIHNEVLKYEAQLAHYLNLIQESIKNDNYNEAMLSKIERGLAELEKIAQTLGIINLLDTTKILELKKGILYLRNLSRSVREKVNKI